MHAPYQAIQHCVPLPEKRAASWGLCVVGWRAHCFTVCAVLSCCCVQRLVLQHIKPDTILVGHALENDLKALKVRLQAETCNIRLTSGCGSKSTGCAATMALPACSREIPCTLACAECRRALLVSIFAYIACCGAVCLQTAAVHTVASVTHLTSNLVCNALQICHSKILDTVALYPHPKGPPARSKLKVLATRVSHHTSCCAALC